MPSETHSYTIFETDAGHCGIAWSSKGVTRFHLPERDVAAAERQIRRRTPGAEATTPSPQIAGIIDAVRHYFIGEPLDLASFASVRPSTDALYP